MPLPNAAIDGSKPVNAEEANETKGEECIMRTAQEIKAEIQKVEKARKSAVHKVKRCDERMDELNRELKAAEQEEAV